MTKTKDLCIFYSWQSDLPAHTNLNAIRRALKAACKKLQTKNPKLTITRDEATRDTSGSPNIAIKILEKIDRADVFVADVTTITLSGSSRPSPNPNVIFELGYAVATLGWERVILLFNEEQGSFPADLPFDFAQHRASPYSLTASVSKPEITQLSALLEVAVAAVLEKNPKTPAELRGLSPEKVRRDQDLQNIKWMLSSIHLPTLDDLIERLPHSVPSKALWFSENFRGVVENSLFHLHDSVLADAVDRLHRSWHTATSHGEQYHDAPGGHLYIFGSPMDAPLDGEREQAWKEIEAARPEMRKALDDILARIREEYVTVNIHKTNLKAWQRYKDDTADERFRLKETQVKDIDKKSDREKTGSKGRKEPKKKKQ